MEATYKIFKEAQLASKELLLLNEKRINAILQDLATKTESNFDKILTENKKDLDIMDPKDPKYDRLKLTKERL